MGKVVFKIGNDVSTDIIYPGRFMATLLPTETPQYAFADDVEFSKKLRAGEILKGSIVVAGQNFGCGSSREQAASCLKGYDLIIVARHFSRIFLQNSINLGLQTIICPDIEADEGNELEIEPEYVQNKTTGGKFKIVPLPKARQAIIDAGGLVPYTKALLLRRMQK
ncbi:MAG: 3-isopropylmalate dehydratase [candidate division Zixibacteria bacterium]|nr:3-isopropylmalate dehydratase [candidate division Zixibacteria bacterium]